MKCDAHRISVRCELLVYSHHLLHVVKLLSHNQFTQYFVCMNIWSSREINSADAPYALVLDTSSAICAVIVSEIKIYIRSSNITSICSAVCIVQQASEMPPDPPRLLPIDPPHGNSICTHLHHRYHHHNVHLRW